MSYSNGSDSTEQNMRKLFIGGLDRNATEEDLRSYFSPFGQIEDLCVIKDKNTQQSKGFGFITFATVEATDAALEDGRSKKEIKILTKSVEVKRAVPRGDTSETAHIRSKQIFVGGLPWGMPEQDVRDAISQWCGTSVPIKIDLIKKQDDPSKLRGFGFIEFDHEDHVDKLVIQGGLKVGDRSIEVKKAVPKDQMGGGGRGGRGGGRSQGGGGGRGGGGGGFSGNYGGNYGNYDSYGGDSSYGYDQGSYGGSGYGGGYGGAGYGSGSYGGGDGYGGGWGGSGGFDQGGRGRGGRYKPY